MKSKACAYNCVIIDDEPLAIQIIEEYLEHFDNLKCIATFTDPAKAFSLLNSEEVHLIFLDINMPGISGLDLIKSFEFPPRIIFTTAYREFGADAFDVNALDYLVKPIALPRFLKAIQKFFSENNFTEIKEKETDYILLKQNKVNYRVPLKSIEVIESLDNYLRVYTVDRQFICYGKISDFQESLPENFLRIQRSFIINIDFVSSFTGTSINLSNRTFKIGRTFKKHVMEVLMNGKETK